MKTVLKTLPLSIFLAACSFTPEYVQPEVALPQSWMEVAIAEQGAGQDNERVILSHASPSSAARAWMIIGCASTSHVPLSPLASRSY